MKYFVIVGLNRKRVETLVYSTTPDKQLNREHNIHYNAEGDTLGSIIMLHAPFWKN